MDLRTAEFIGRRLRPVELRLLAKFLLGVRRKVIELSDGRKYSIDPVSDLGLHLMKDGHYEIPMTHAIQSILKTGDCFIDLGSNEGYFAVLAGKIVGTRGKVFAIEPQDRLQEVIRKNLELNDLDNCKLLTCGIGSEEGEMMLHLYPSINTGASSFSEHLNFKVSFAWLRKRIYGTQVAGISTLDRLQPDFPASVKLLKIDIEGFELEALKGSKDCLSRQMFHNILVEIHPQALAGMGQDVQEIEILLRQYGYQKQNIGYNLDLYSVHTESIRK